MIYKYYVTYNLVQTEVHPTGVNGLKITGEQEEDRIFTRRKLDGELTFKGSEYTYFKNIDDDSEGKCAEIQFLVLRSCDNGQTWDEFWNGYFSTTDGTFDVDKCLFTIEAKPDDEYRCLLENSKKEIGFLDIQQTTTSGIVPDVTYEFYTCRDTIVNCNSTRPGPDAAGTWLPFHTETIDGETTTIYYREIVVTACEAGIAVSPPGSGWVEVTATPPTCANEGLTKWVRQPITVVVYNPNPEVSPGNCEEGTASIPPMEKEIEVTISSSRTTPPIVGSNKIIQSSGSLFSCNSTYVYTIEYPAPGSTFLWSITSGTIISGQGTNQVTISCGTPGTVTLSCTETSSCGVHTTSSLVITVNALGVIPYGHYDIPFTCIDSLCQWQDNIIFKVPKLYGAGLGVNVFSFIFSINHGTYTTNDLGDGYITYIIDASGVSDAIDTIDIDLTVNGAGSCVPDWSASHTIIKKGNFETQDIIGSESVCPGAIMTYNIQGRDDASYQWTITGGVINSGATTQTVNVTWGVAGTGTIAVKETLNCTCDWLKISDCGYTNEPSFYWCRETNYTWSRNWLLQNVINAVKDNICSDVDDVVSDFFEWNPPGDTSGYVSGINYVTGAPNKLTYLSIAPAIDIYYIDEIIAQTKQADVKQKLTWDIIEKILHDVFNCFWFIENSTLRIEHYSWFQRTARYNLTTGIYLKYIEGKNIYKYDKLEVPKYERFRWAQSLNTDFTGAEISYSGLCVNQDEKTNVKTYNVDNITTDIIYLLSGDEEVNVDGLVLMANGSDYKLLEEEGLITNVSFANCHLSWANLHYNYFRHGRAIMNGRMNLQDIVFLSSIRNKTQEGVPFPFCCTDTIEPENDLITTKLGSGVVKKYELDLKTNIIIVDLLHT